LSLTKEFKEFISRGNVVDLAVGVIIGASFGKIVSSLVADIIMPPIGFIIGGINFSALKIILKQPAIDPLTGKPIDALAINYGIFLQSMLDFVIIAFAIFMFVKIFNSIKRKEEEAPPLVQTAEEKLLIEIRDLLAAKK
jgi:large conductance mechanosensitive channel